jgi:PPOX class probable F420-dependent enzyme
MNRREQIKLTADEQAQFLRDVRKLSLATLDKDGFPHLVAMNFGVRDGAILMTSYGKAQKVVNIRRNPKVAVMIESGRSYAELRGVMMRGECEIIEDPAAVRDAMLAIRSGGSSDASVPEIPAAVVSKRVVLKLVPAKVTSWDHRKLGGRY